MVVVDIYNESLEGTFILIRHITNETPEEQQARYIADNYYHTVDKHTTSLHYNQRKEMVT